MTSKDILFEAQPGIVLDWGSLFNFRFDVFDLAGEGEATMGVFESGIPAGFSINTRIPLAFCFPEADLPAMFPVLAKNLLYF